MQTDLERRFYASGWLSLGRAARMAKLDRYALGVALAERGICCPDDNNIGCTFKAVL